MYWVFLIGSCVIFKRLIESFCIWVVVVEELIGIFKFIVEFVIGKFGLWVVLYIYYIR